MFVENDAGRFGSGGKANDKKQEPNFKGDSGRVINLTADKNKVPNKVRRTVYGPFM